MQRYARSAHLSGELSTRKGNANAPFLPTAPVIFNSDGGVLPLPHGPSQSAAAYLSSGNGTAARLEAPQTPSVPQRATPRGFGDHVAANNSAEVVGGRTSEPVSVHNGLSDPSSDDDSEQYSTSPASSGSSPMAEASGSRELFACCIAERKADGAYAVCTRRVSGIWLSEKLRELSAIKRFPFVYNTARRHYYVCLYHQRVIRNEPALRKGESLKSRELSKYDRDKTLTEEEMRQVADDPLVKFPTRHRSRSGSSPGDETNTKKKRKLNGKAAETSTTDEGTESDESAEYTEERPRRSARHLSNGSGTPQTPLVNGKAGNGTRKEKPKKDEKPLPPKEEPSAGETDKEDCLESSEVPLKVLSATTLRRYKKFFKLSHRSGTNTKPQLLEGVSEHFESLTTPVNETIAYFIFTAKLHRNKLDYPNGGTTVDSASQAAVTSS